MSGRRKEPILGYVPRNDQKKNLVHKGLSFNHIWKRSNLIELAGLHIIKTLFIPVSRRRGLAEYKNEHQEISYFIIFMVAPEMCFAY